MEQKFKSPKDMIFVFGSNMAGIHGAGAAKYAHQHKQAKLGVGEGLTGQAYALPTKDHKIRCISLAEIHGAVFRFKDFAEANPNLEFQVTRVGCGLGGHRDEDICKMFLDSPDNCYFDTVWQPLFAELGLKKSYWGTF